MTKYAVWIQLDYDDEGMYASADNPFNYESKPLLFINKDTAEEYAKSWRTGTVVEYPHVHS
jgi:hypothetical protein